MVGGATAAFVEGATSGAPATMLPPAGTDDGRRPKDGSGWQRTSSGGVTTAAGVEGDDERARRAAATTRTLAPMSNGCFRRRMAPAAAGDTASTRSYLATGGRLERLRGGVANVAAIALTGRRPSSR